MAVFVKRLELSKYPNCEERFLHTWLHPVSHFIKSKLLVNKTFIRGYTIQQWTDMLKRHTCFNSLAVCNIPVDTLMVKAVPFGNCSS